WSPRRGTRTGSSPAMPMTAAARRSSRVSALVSALCSSTYLFHRLIEFIPLEIDPQVQRQLGDVLLGEDDMALVFAQVLDATYQALELLHQHPAALRDAGLERVVAFHDRFVGLDPARDVVGLHGQ